MILWFVHAVWALECTIDPTLIEAGTIEEGFSSFFYEDDGRIIQDSPHWNDQIARMSLIFDEAPQENFSIRWTSQLQGTLYESPSTQYAQLWAPHLRAGTHQISVAVKTASGKTCSSSVSLRVEVPPLHCGFVSEDDLGFFQAEEIGLEEKGIENPYEFDNPFPRERIFYVVINTRSNESLEAWVQDDRTKKKYPVALKGSSAQMNLPPQEGEHTLSLVVSSKKGRRCTSSLRFTEPPPLVESENSSDVDQGYLDKPDVMAASSFGLAHHSGWGGEGVFTPSFDMVVAARVNDLGYMIGGDFNFDFREAYRKYLLKTKVGILNGVVVGPVVILTGGGLGYDEIKGINSDFTEDKLYENNHLFAYWRSDIFLWLTPQIAISGGFIPRWHWSDDITSELPWDSYSWHSNIRLAVITFSYQQQRVLEKTIHSAGISIGGNLLE